MTIIRSGARVASFIGAALLLAACSAQGPSESFTRTMDVNAPASDVWAMIGSFCSIQDWHPVIGTCEEDGASPPTRTLVTADGQATFVELEASRDDDGFSYSYDILSSPLPMTDYTGTISVADNGDGTSTITWNGVYNVEEENAQVMIDTLTGVYDAGMTAVAASYAN